VTSGCVRAVGSDRQRRCIIRPIGVSVARCCSTSWLSVTSATTPFTKAGMRESSSSECVPLQRLRGQDKPPVGLLLPRRARVSATEATSLLRLPGRSTAGTNEQTLHDLSHEAAAGLLREGQPPLSVREQNPEGVSIAYVPGLPVHSDPGVRDEEETAMSLEIQPIEFDEACAFVRQHHRR